MTQFAVCILAGGEGSRLPGKLERDWNGEPLLGRVYDNVSGSYPVYVAARSSFSRELDERLDCIVVVDRWPKRGPLGGLCSAFGEMHAERVFVVAGDAPEVTGATLDLLRAAWRPGDTAVVARDGERIQPLLGLYDRACFLDAAFDELAASASVTAVARRLNARPVDVPPSALRNINTLADIEVRT